MQSQWEDDSSNLCKAMEASPPVCAKLRRRSELALPIVVTGTTRRARRKPPRAIPTTICLRESSLCSPRFRCLLATRDTLQT